MPDGVTRPARQRSHTGLVRDELEQAHQSIPLKQRLAWTRALPAEFEDKDGFENEFVRYVTSGLARNMYNCDEVAAYQSAAHTVRDRLVSMWEKTHQSTALEDPKRVYYLSLEFLMGRALDNAMLNVGVKSVVRDGVAELGFRLEDLIETEQDAALGNGGLGRLAACYLDSFATMNLPGWGYGIRYRYGIFQQTIVDGQQHEQPDYWLSFTNPWEVHRADIVVPVRFGGWVRKHTDDEGRRRSVWEGGQTVLAVAYDCPIPGYGTKTCNNLRLWASRPNTEFDFQRFNAGDYASSVREHEEAGTITAVLYPNENFDRGKELRLKQQYFWVCASMHDIVRRFKKSELHWTEFSNRVAIQLNDTHPTIAIPELQRILVDEEGVEWDLAWEQVTRTFGFTNHTIMSEALEKWPVPMMEHLLPRILEIIYDINLDFLRSVEKKFPDDRGLLARVSIIEESTPKFVRMAHLAIVGSHKVNGVSELHSALIARTIFADFAAVFRDEKKFFNVTNGITPRRWLHQANPGLSALITSALGTNEFVRDLDLLSGLERFADDPAFCQRFREVKLLNKRRLAEYIKKYNGLEIDPEKALFDVQVKRIHEYKRQQLNIFSVIHRYLRLKAASAEERSKEQPRACIFGGKAAPGYYQAKAIIQLINAVASVVNADPDVRGLLSVCFIADYNVSKAEIIAPASDISQHISTAGTEASGTSNMKFVLNGGLIIGTWDGANIEIAREVGAENMFIFGHSAEEVEELRHRHVFGDTPLDANLRVVFEAIERGVFGDPNPFSSLLRSITHEGDRFLVSDDFASYLECQRLVDEAYADGDAWTAKTIRAVARMGFFSSDRAVQEYVDNVWNVKPLDLPADWLSV